METIGYILTALALVWVWSVKSHKILFRTVKAKNDCEVDTVIIRNRLCALVEKSYLLNCETCQCFWIGIILFFTFDYQIYFLPLPLYYGLINKHL